MLIQLEYPGTDEDALDGGIDYIGQRPDAIGFPKASLMTDQHEINLIE